MKEHMAQFGPCVLPNYPYSTFSRFPPEIDFKDVWRVVGPTVQRNINHAPLWVQFCTVYLEGLNHGAAAAAEQPTVSVAHVQDSK
jgi:hypothetical protein